MESWEPKEESRSNRKGWLSASNAVEKKKKIRTKLSLRFNSTEVTGDTGEYLVSPEDGLQ